MSAEIIADCFEKIMDEMNYTYEDFENVSYSESGEVRLISENSVNVNKLKNKMLKEIQKGLNNDNLYTFSLPLGAFTDSNLLSSSGPPVEISFKLTGSANCSIKNKFESGGVNQTLHKIYLVVVTDVISQTRDFEEEYSFKTEYEIAQTVIIGSIPSTYADIVR